MDTGSSRERHDESPPDSDGLSEEELATHAAEAIPDRAALSTVGADVTIPVDAALAADVLSGLVGDEAEGLEAPAAEDPPAGDERDPAG